MFLGATAKLLGEEQRVRETVHPEADIKKGTFVLIAIVAICIFYLLTIRAGHHWGDDFSMYIQHAKNIAEGVNYRNSNYIYCPPYVGPNFYPPILPLLLAPIIKLFGLNLTAMKVELILVFALSLFMLVQVVKDFLPRDWQLALVLLVGFNPYYWSVKEGIESEVPFYLMVFLSVYLVHKAYDRLDRETSLKIKLGYILATGVSFYLAYGTRIVGLVLIPSLVLYDLIRNRKVTFFAVGTIIVAAALMIAQSVLLRGGQSYVEFIQGDHQGILIMDWINMLMINIPRYTSSLTRIWDNGYFKLPRLGMTVLIFGLALIGFLAQLRKRITFIELFVVLYTTCIVIMPMDGGVRYLLPVIPFFLFHSLQGIRLLTERSKMKNLALGSIAAAILVTYGLAYSTYSLQEVPKSITSPEAVEFLNYINQKTDPNEVIIFGKPRALALYTSRKSSIYPIMGDDKGRWSYFKRIKATFIVLGPLGVEPHEDEFLAGFLNRNQGFIREEFSNSIFKVYRITNFPEDAPQNQIVRLFDRKLSK